MFIVKHWEQLDFDGRLLHVVRCNQANKKNQYLFVNQFNLIPRWIQFKPVCAIFRKISIIKVQLKNSNYYLKAKFARSALLVICWLEVKKNDVVIRLRLLAFLTLKRKSLTFSSQRDRLTWSGNLQNNFFGPELNWMWGSSKLDKALKLEHILFWKGF